MDDMIAFKFWYGGKFSSDDDDMSYIGGMDRTFQVSLDDLCFEFLMSLASQCIESKYIEGLYYLKPGLSLKDGLRKVVGEVGNFHLRKAAVENPLVNVYIVQTLPKSCLSYVLAKPRDKQQDSVFQKSSSTSRPPKLPFVRGPQSGSSGKFDNPQRSISLDSTINAPQQQHNPETLDKGKHPQPKTTQKQAVVEEIESEDEFLHNDDIDLDSDDDEDYVVSSSEESEEELLNNNDVIAESSEDEEYVIARERVRGTCSKLLQTAVEVQKQAATGCLGSQTESASPVNEVVDDGGHVSDYADSNHEMDTPPESDDDEGVELRRKKRALTVEKKTCSCRKWDLTGIPCRHAIACISFLHHIVEDYIDPIYHKSHYGKAYSSSIPPIEGSRFWPRIESSLIPPPIKVGPGRPRINRRKDPHESPKRPGNFQGMALK